MKRKLSSIILGILCLITIANAQVTKPARKVAFNSISVKSTTGDFDPCVALLKDGLRDVYTTADHVSLFDNSKSYFASNEFVRDYHDGKWSGGISVIIDGIPLGLSAGSSSNDLHEFQRQIEQASSVIIQLETYSTITRSTLNVDLANSFNKCIEINQKYGLSIDVSGEKTAAVTIKYRALASSDRRPSITSVDLVGINEKERTALLAGRLKRGTILGDQLSFTATRKAGEELLIGINTSNGLSIVKRLENDDDAGYSNLPIGTIISSVLDFDNFSKLTKSNGNVGVWSIKSKWAPCDGRSVAGSKYQVIWAGALGPNLPDLRGVFLRGLNQFDKQEGTKVDAQQANPDEPSKRNMVQVDAVGKHTHPIDLRTGYMLDLGNWPNPPPASIFTGDRPAYNNSYGKLTAIESPTAKDETRPKNVSVFYYIRIN